MKHRGTETRSREARFRPTRIAPTRSAASTTTLPVPANFSRSVPWAVSSYPNTETELPECTVVGEPTELTRVKPPPCRPPRGGKKRDANARPLS